MQKDLSNELFIESWNRLGCDDYLPAEKVLEIFCKCSEDIYDANRDILISALCVYTKRMAFEQHVNKVKDIRKNIIKAQDELQCVQKEVNLLKSIKSKELNDKELEQILRMKYEQNLYNIKDELIKENLKLMREIEEHRSQIDVGKENLKEVQDDINELKSVYAEKFHTIDLLDEKLKKMQEEFLELDTKLRTMKEHYVSAEHLETRAVELDKREKVVTVYEGKKLENIKTMIEDKKVQLNTIVKDIDKKQDKIDSLKEQISDLIQQRNSEIDQLQQARLDKANEIYRLRDDISSIKNVQYIANKEYDNVASEIVEKTKVLNSIERRIVTKTGILKALKIEYDKIKAALEVNNINLHAYTDYGNRFLTLINQLQDALIILATKRGIKVDNSVQALEFIKKYKQITTDKIVSKGVLPVLSCDTLALEVLDVYTELYGTQLDDSILRDLALIKKHGSIEEYLERFKNEF